MAANRVSVGKQGGRQIIVAPDAQGVADIAAERLLARLRGDHPRYAVCLTGGSGPLALFDRLAAAPYRDAIPWGRVHWFIGDERFVPADDPLNNMRAARRAFLDTLALPENIHPIDTSAANPDEAARRYERTLQDFYGATRLDPARPLFDFVLMGLGGDGHTASLFPGSQALDEHRRWVVGIDRAGLEPFVPRVTLTLPTLASTQEMLFLVSGAGKSAILARVLAGDVLPASRAYSDGALVWLVDRAAAPDDRHAS